MEVWSDSATALTECQKHLPDYPGTESPECSLPGLGTFLPDPGRSLMVKQASRKAGFRKLCFTMVSRW